MKYYFSILACVLSLVVSSELHAQFWQSLDGPPGIAGSIMAVSPNGDLFVVSNFLERSTDGGKSWLHIDLPFSGLYITDIRAPRTGVLYAVAQNILSNPLPQNGMWRSLDNGDTWTQIMQMPIKRMNILPNGEFFALQASQTNQFTDLFSFSTDNGDSWTDGSAQVVGNITNVWGDKAGILFLSTTQFLYRSTDLGESWNKIVNGLPISGSDNEGMYKSLAQTSKGDLYLLRGSGSGLFRSTDEGSTWTADSLVKSNLSGELLDLKISPNGKMSIVSTNGGVVSDDFGKTTNPSIPNSIPVLDSTTNQFYFDITSTIFHSGFGINDTLTKINIPNSTVTALISHPDGSLIAMTKDNPDGASSLWRSSNGGTNWSNILATTSGNCIAMDSSHHLLSALNGDIMLSTNSGISWSKNTTLTQGAITSIAVDKFGNIFATSSSEGVFRSTDDATTWYQNNNGLSDQSLEAVAIHPNGDIFIGAKNAIYESNDHGLSWTKLNTNFPTNAGNVDAMVVSTQGNIIAGINGIGIWWSTNSGATWSQHAVGFTGTKVNALLSTMVGKVFAASDSGVFYLDTTVGISWVPYHSGITVKNTLSLCRDANGRLYCGTSEAGAYSSFETFNVTTSGVVNSDRDNSVNALGTSFLNPVTSSAKIPFTVGERSHVTIEILDLLGRLLSTIISQDCEAGSYSANFDANKLSSGMYYIRMKVGAQSLTKPLIVAK